MFRQWCLAHELALLVKDQLASLETYWGSLAKLINVWRTGSNAKALRASWSFLYGTDRAKSAAGKLPPRPLRGRWGSASRTEAVVLHATRSELTAVFKDCFVDSKQNKKPPKKKAKNAVPDIDEDMVEAINQPNRFCVIAASGLFFILFFWGFVVPHTTA